MERHISIPTTDVDPQQLLQSFSQNRQFQVCDNALTEDKVYPSPPFITTTLQRCASKKLRYSVKKTMDIAQKLFDSGKITYMRTDSMAVSSYFKPHFVIISKKHTPKNTTNRQCQNVR